MTSQERRAHIADQLKIQGEASITELVATLGTSEMTIRRDLELLELEGVARRIRGGAIAAQSRANEPPILQRAAIRADAKRRIGGRRLVVARRRDGVPDVGTTTLEMAKAIPLDVALTVLTSSLLIASELDAKPLERTLVSGGIVRRGEMSLVGSRRTCVRGTHLRHRVPRRRRCQCGKGASEYNLDDAWVKQAARLAARRVVVLADASKIGRVSLITVVALDAVDLLITDAAPDGAAIHQIKERDVEVLHVAPFTKESTE